MFYLLFIVSHNIPHAYIMVVNNLYGTVQKSVNETNRI